jgi:hypothetical protein
VLETYYTRLGVTDEYYEMESRRKTDSVEMVLDAIEWLGLKYKAKVQGFRTSLCPTDREGFEQDR